jgi:hypothetical protein
MERGPPTGPEGGKITTDWFFEAECPPPDNEADNEGEIIKDCSGCPYVVWENPEKVAFFVGSMCGGNVGIYSMAAEPIQTP